MSHRFFPTLLFVFLSLGVFSQNAAPFFEGKIQFTGEVYFDFAKHDLRPDADSVLSAIKSFVEDKENLKIEITAHTDSIGSLENNMALSQRRSESVRIALLEMGIEEDVLTILDFGETKPATTNSTDEGRQANRRATIEIVKYPPMGFVEGYVKDAKTKESLESMVVFRNKAWRDTLYTDSSGYFKKELPIGLVVGVDAFADCHFFASKMTKSTRKKPPLEFLLAPIIQGQVITLNNLYFYGAKYVLLPKSKPELPKIKRFLESNPEMKIEIAGHINYPNHPPVDTNTWNYRLSHNRAKMVHDYLVENGISEERISYKGYGNWEMVYPKAREEKYQKKNRRVELRVLEAACQ